MSLNFNIKFERKDLWLLAAIMVFIVGVGYVIAFNAGFSGGNPSVMGHSSDEVWVNFNGTQMNLQSALNLLAVGGVGGSLAFGAWQDVTSVASGGAVQGPAASDGFVLASSGSIGVIVGGYTDSDITNVQNSAPIALKIDMSQSSNAGSDSSFTMPVKKGDYWKVINVDQKVLWIPLNCGGSSGGSFGGSYWKQNGVCQDANPYTNDCTCPLGYSSSKQFNIVISGCQPCESFYCYK